MNEPSRDATRILYVDDEVQHVEGRGLRNLDAAHHRRLHLVELDPEAGDFAHRVIFPQRRAANRDH